MKKLILLVVLATSLSLHAGIYTCKDANGVTTYQGKPCKGQVKVEKPEEDQKINQSDSSADKQKTAKSSSTVKLSQQGLQGKWHVTKMNGENLADMGMDKEFWEFKGNELTVYSDGKSLRPDKYSLKSDAIVMQGYEVKVIKLTSNALHIEVMGMVQEMVKQ